MPSGLVTSGREERVRSLGKEMGNTQDWLYASDSMTIVNLLVHTRETECQGKTGAKNSHQGRL